MESVIKQCGKTYKRIMCHTLSTDFRKSTEIVEVAFPALLGQKDVVVQNHFLGVNASDINFTNGRYDPTARPPFPCGFESLGKIKAVGSEVKGLATGDTVVVTAYGCFSEYSIVPAKTVMKVPFLSPTILPMTVCGLTASLALEKVGQMKHGETVLVTAAAGATGQFAVQLAKLAGNHVIGTCSSQTKVDHLLSIGCDRAINYKEEDLSQVLKEEYPNGVDLVFECVGGSMFDASVNNLAVGGRLIIIGAVSGYQDDSAWKTADKTDSKGIPLNMKLLSKSASIRGFFLNHFTSDMPSHVKKLSQLVQKGLVNPGVDPTPFIGLESVSDAIDYMYSRKNIGKLVVQMPIDESSRL